MNHHAIYARASQAVIEGISLQEAQQVTGGVLTGGNPVFRSVSTDTRTLQPGDFFIALRGPTFNGNSFVELAAQKGACGALVAEFVSPVLPLLTVHDTRIALGQLGAYNRKLTHARVLGLTGSQGKTTVKEMTAAILGCRGTVLSTKGNLNNDLGVPLTLLQIGREHQFAVIEMGANAPGEIAYTTQLARPDIAHITNVAPTHLEGFGSLQGVARAKAELWQGLVPGGTAIVNIDDPNVLDAFSAREDIRAVTLSASGRSDADYALEAWNDKGIAGSEFALCTPQGRFNVKLALPGRHNAANALAAAALAMEAGAGPRDVILGLADMRSVKGRLNIRKGLRGSVILDDTYNASPSSFRAAIDVLVKQPGIRIVVAGDMGELGSEKEAAHRALGNYARDRGVEYFFGTGTLSQLAVAAFGSKGMHRNNCNDLATALLPLLAPGVSVLVKGSRSAGMERVVQQLTERED
ncbi:MAG TPA: UDP-N-acetylmuramoyl-tripeptide--D-alanyl-D-alanine ligase [Pseudomonadales bacterium]